MDLNSESESENEYDEIQNGLNTLEEALSLNLLNTLPSYVHEVRKKIEDYLDKIIEKTSSESDESESSSSNDVSICNTTISYKQVPHELFAMQESERDNTFSDTFESLAKGKGKITDHKSDIEDIVDL